MAGPLATTEGIAAPQEHAGLPQMRYQTFPSQIFWLAVTFALLFLMLWRVTLPMIAGVIDARRNRIEGDLSEAENLRKDAAGALAAYEASLAEARNRAHQLADENRKTILAELDGMKATAEAEAQAAMNEVERRILSDRTKSVSAVKTAAAEAAAAIVERLIGTKIRIEDAANAVAVETETR